jgi:hypothetical protein
MESIAHRDVYSPWIALVPIRRVEGERDLRGAVLAAGDPRRVPGTVAEAAGASVQMVIPQVDGELDHPTVELESP